MGEMMKTSNTILSELALVIDSTAIKALSGDIYKVTRPTDSVLEDCVIHLIPGTTAKFVQDGAIFVKIFFLDINMGNTYYQDFINGNAKEVLLFTLSELFLKTPGYSFFIESREIYIEAVEEIHQHYAILKMNFKVLI
jgi:hypothetical protein